MLTWKSKLLIAIGIVALITGLLLVIKYQRDIIAKQTAIQNSLVDMKKIQGDITRSQVQYATPGDLDKLANSLNLKLDPIKDDLSSMKAHVTGIQTITVNSAGENKSNIASTSTTPRTDPVVANEPVDPYKYQENAQSLSLVEPFGKTNVPIGSVEFRAWSPTPWQLNQFPRTYSVTNVLGADENGKTYTYSKFMVNVDGKTYDVDINDTKLVEELPQSKLRFSPRFFLGVSAGTTFNAPKFELIPSLEMMFLSYGQAYPTWEFLGAGIGFDIKNNNFQFMISPFDYNVGQYIPFMKNLYVGPAVSFSSSATFSVLGGIRVGL